jgi:anti-sigma regulatory factor (Ser/Thr protein kinase)
LAQERQDAVVLAVDEACSNVVRHAYGSEASGAIELAIGQHDGWLQVEVVDWGTPAPPEALVPKPRSAPKRSTVKPGGLGLQLIHSVFDEVDYGRGDDGANVLRLRLRMPAAGQRENQCNGPDAETHGREQDHGA